MMTTIQCTTLATSMQMQCCHVLWHKCTLSIILKRELRDCDPSREVPVLHVKRHRVFGGDLEITLGGSIHPVRMLPVSGKDVRTLRFGLVYGPKRKRLRFRPPDLTTYTTWEMILEVAVVKAAAERPTLPSLPCSRKFSIVEDCCFSDEFGFSDNNTCDETKLHDSQLVNLPPQIIPATASFIDFTDSSFPQETLHEHVDPRSWIERDNEAPCTPLAHEVDVVRPTLLSISDKLIGMNDVNPSLFLSQDNVYAKIALLEDPCATTVSARRIGWMQSAIG
ncbi:hypothetical protein PsorP6_007943 [Peronosclerospora sorghi]|uniref:Uncharacterized protein n=1 Tax=Peronosclerospora sorghi TaxID=230839 RepID=A0ACC0WAA4_9STRA|nr:hypothetical protein PsorP6_007943 [Peronosclerospora sorghi]